MSFQLYIMEIEIMTIIKLTPEEEASYQEDIIDYDLRGRLYQDIPTVFRVVEISTSKMDDGSYVHKAELFHQDCRLSVSWNNDQSYSGVSVFDLVTPQRLTFRNNWVHLAKGGLQVIEEPDASINLFKTAPNSWVNYRDYLLKNAANYWDQMDEDCKLIFNQLMWQKDFFQRYCETPSSKDHHHNYLGGNLDHSVHVVDIMMALAKDPQIRVNKSILILIGLIHDAGKFKEFFYQASGQDRPVICRTPHAKLIGHKTLLMMMLGEAQSKLDDQIDQNKFLHIIHCISSHYGGKPWLGIPSPLLQEAMLLQAADHLSSEVDVHNSLFDQYEDRVSSNFHPIYRAQVYRSLGS